MTAQVPAAPGSPWCGWPSLVGAVVGVLLWALPYATFSRPVWVWVVPPVAGLVLIAFRGGAPQAGMGLFASCAVLPVALMAFGLISFTF